MITSLPTERISDITVANVYQSFTHKMAAKASWRRNYVTVTRFICSAYWETEGATKSNHQSVSTSAAPVCVLIVLDVLMAVVQSI